jgi:hypothetical protein
MSNPIVFLLVGSLADTLYTGIAYYGSRVVELLAHVNPMQLVPVVRRKVVMCWVVPGQRSTHNKKARYSSTYMYLECIQQTLSMGKPWPCDHCLLPTL